MCIGVRGNEGNCPPTHPHINIQNWRESYVLPPPFYTFVAKIKEKAKFLVWKQPKKNHIVQLTKDIIPPFFSRLTILNILVHSYNLTPPLPDPPYWLYYLTIDTQTNKKKGVSLIYNPGYF